jgi:hypothetical protein
LLATYLAGPNPSITAADVNGDGQPDLLTADHDLGAYGLPGLSVLLNHGPGLGRAWTDLGYALDGTNGAPSLVGTGTLWPASAGSLQLKHAKPLSLAILFVSFASSPVPFKGGTLVTVPVLLSLPLATDGTGSLALPFVWPAGVPAATPLYFQSAIQDAAGPQGAALSNALKAVTP